MRSYISNSVISELTLDFVLLPVLDVVTHVISWLHSVVDVVDKCFDSMPRGPAGSSHGDFAEVEFTVNSGDASSENQQQGVVARIRKSLKLVELSSISNSRISSGRDQRADEKVDYVCSVCLGGIQEEENVYELPLCNHIFHSACLDRWVGHNHYSCPLCRTSLITDTSHCIGSTIMQDDQEGLAEEDPGFSLRIWIVSRYATHVNFDILGWTHSVMRFAGF